MGRKISTALIVIVVVATLTLGLVFLGLNWSKLVSGATLYTDLDIKSALEQGFIESAGEIERLNKELDEIEARWQTKYDNMVTYYEGELARYRDELERKIAYCREIEGQLLGMLALVYEVNPNSAEAFEYLLETYNVILYGKKNETGERIGGGLIDDKAFAISEIERLNTRVVSFKENVKLLKEQISDAQYARDRLSKRIQEFDRAHATINKDEPYYNDAKGYLWRDERYGEYVPDYNGYDVYYGTIVADTMNGPTGLSFNLSEKISEPEKYYTYNTTYYRYYLSAKDGVRYATAVSDWLKKQNETQVRADYDNQLEIINTRTAMMNMANAEIADITGRQIAVQEYIRDTTEQSIQDFLQKIKEVESEIQRLKGEK